MASGDRVIRQAGLNDALPISAIYSESIRARDSTMHTHPVGASEVAQWLQDMGPRECLAVAETAIGVVGWGILKRYHPRPGYAAAGETSVYIARKNTGQGHGSKLQEYLINRARALDYHHLVAKIWAANAGSIRMHERFGYEVVGVQREIGFIEGRRIDVAILQLVLA